MTKLRIPRQSLFLKKKKKIGPEREKQSDGVGQLEVSKDF